MVKIRTIEYNNKKYTYIYDETSDTLTLLNHDISFEDDGECFEEFYTIDFFVRDDGFNSHIEITKEIKDETFCAVKLRDEDVLYVSDDFPKDDLIVIAMCIYWTKNYTFPVVEEAKTQKQTIQELAKTYLTDNF